MEILDRLNQMQCERGKNRLVIILDGMGVAIMDKILSPNGFFHRNLIGSTRAVIPATTVAATIAYRTGKMPWETGFVGWSQYFAETDEVIEVFTNNNYYTGEVSRLKQPSWTLPCKTVVQQMNEDGRRAFEIMPAFVPGGCATFEEWLDKIVETCNSERDAYVYAYWAQPDSLLHSMGTDDASVAVLLRDMESSIDAALQKIQNPTDVLITADHGHHDLKYFTLDDFPDVARCLAHPLSIEARCASLFVRPECVADFPEIFNRHFGAHFRLVPKDVFERDYLYARAPVRFIGDFVAIATGDYGLCTLAHPGEHKSNHAGITDAEMTIPLIRVTRGN